MLIAVAGASGRLGRVFLAYCRQKGLPAFALLRTVQSSEKLPAGTPYSIVGYKDSGGLHALAKALEGTTHIVNLTGSTDTSLFEDDMYEANVVPTKALLEAAPPTLERFVHLSSIAVYGKKPPRADIMDESSPKKPTDAYGRSKLDGEAIALSNSAKFSVISLQPSIIYGQGFESGFYPVLSALKAGKMQIIGNGENHIPLVHCDDVADAIAKALFASVQSGSSYVLTYEPVLTQNELMAMAAEALHVPPPEKKIGHAHARSLLMVRNFISKFRGITPSLTPDMLTQLYLDRPFTSKKARIELAWRPAIDFKTGIEQVVNDFNSGGQ